MKMTGPNIDPTCPRCRTRGRETFHYSHGRFKFDVERAWKLIDDHREILELDRESIEWSLRGAAIDDGHLDHVDPSIPGLIAHIWIRSDDGEISRGHALIDGNHRAARCLRDGLPFLVYVLSEDESDAILLHSPNKSKPALAPT